METMKKLTHNVSAMTQRGRSKLPYKELSSAQGKIENATLCRISPTFRLARMSNCNSEKCE